jgi:hypothetical protein
MNKFYRVIYSAARGAFVAVGENVRAHAGGSSRARGELVGGSCIDVLGTCAMFSAWILGFMVVALLALVLFPVAGFVVAPTVTAAPAAQRPNVSWGRKREPMKTFLNVAANSTATSIIPRYPRTIHYFLLEKGGTTFTDAQLTRVELFLGEKSIWGPLKASDIRAITRYMHGATEFGGEPNNDPGSPGAYNGTFLKIDFTNPNIKELGGEVVGGLDMTLLPDGQLRIECDIGGATAPTLKGHVCWGPPHGGTFGRLMRKLIRRNYPAQPAGDFFPIIDVRGAIIARQYWFFTVANAVVATGFALATEGRTNTGNGVVTGTVPVLTPAGRYQLLCAKAGPSAVFELVNPKGKVIGCITSAAGALPVTDGPTLTVTDGGAAWAVGDGFWIDVLKPNEDANLNTIELKKNEDFWYFRTERALRQEQQEYGRMPQAGLLVMDPLTDNHGDSFIDTADAATMDYRINLTAGDTPYVVHEIVAQPILT